MSDENEQEPYVDPNSGLATQPGGHANVLGVAFDPETDEDPNPDPGGSSVLVDGVVTDAAEAGEVVDPENYTAPEDANEVDDPDEDFTTELEDEFSASDYADREHQATGDLVGPGEPNPDEGGSSEVVDGVVTEVETEENEVGADGTPADTTEVELDEGNSRQPAVEEPNKNASRADWVEFARTKGASEEELGEDGLKRDELVAKYGS